MGFWFLYKICAIVQAKWIFLWLLKIIFFVFRVHNFYGKIIKSRKKHFKEPLLTIEKIWNIENLKVKICLIWQCFVSYFSIVVSRTMGFCVWLRQSAWCQFLRQNWPKLRMYFDKKAFDPLKVMARVFSPMHHSSRTAPPTNNKRHSATNNISFHLQEQPLPLITKDTSH